MLRMPRWHRIALAVSLCCALMPAAHAYIDPGTGSIVYTLALAPVLAGLAWLGRRIVRLLTGRKEQEAQSDEEADAEPQS